MKGETVSGNYTGLDAAMVARLADDALAEQLQLLLAERDRRLGAEAVTLLRQWLALPETQEEVGGDAITHVIVPARQRDYDTEYTYEFDLGVLVTESGRRLDAAEYGLDTFGRADRLAEVGTALSDYPGAAEDSALVVDLAVGSMEFTTVYVADSRFPLAD